MSMSAVAVVPPWSGQRKARGRLFDHRLESAAPASAPAGARIATDAPVLRGRAPKYQPRRVRSGFGTGSGSLSFESRAENDTGTVAIPALEGSNGDLEGACALARDYSKLFPPLFADGKSGFAGPDFSHGERKTGMGQRTRSVADEP